MRVDELGKLIVVFDVPLGELDLVAPVELLYVTLNVLHHDVPVMLGMNIDFCPSCFLLILTKLANLTSEMHELLGDAADVHAGASEAPGGALGAWFDEICEPDFCPVLGSRLR